MDNWFDIIPPDEDICKGNFNEAIFAADLGDVDDGIAPADYRDPYLFYKKTYMTDGLTRLLGQVYTKLNTGQGPSVVQIQTPFGGGKTHALVAIYHYLKHGERVQSLLPPNLGLVTPRRAVIVGTHWNPLTGNTTDGITRHTWWGELAFRIGGAAGYEQFRRNDEARISPGKDDLRRFLEAHQPFVILMDEILEYLNRANDVRDQLTVSLGSQTFAFLQELTDTMLSLDYGMLIATLPASVLEDYGETEEESLARLGKIFGRVETIETPVRGEEVYAVIRRRLFEEERLNGIMADEVINHYFQLYQQHRDDLPPKSRELSFRERMTRAYPFHPDVIDILYEKWSTFPTFQRTRGVLRLLASVVEDLYNRQVNLDLILPGDINLNEPTIRREFIKHIGDQYEGIIGSDIAGHGAKATALDTANRSWKGLAQRVSTAIFFQSFAADKAGRGVNLAQTKLATLGSNAIPALASDILQRLANELWYLNSQGDAFYFSNIPNLNRMILDKKELYKNAYEEEMKAVITKELGNKFRAYVWRPSSDEIPDNRELKLVLLHPNSDSRRIQEWVERKGQSFREFKNTLIFAVPDTAGFAHLREEIKTYLALKEIRGEIEANAQSPLAAKRSEVQDRMVKISRDFSYNVRRMYRTLQTARRTIDLNDPVSTPEALDHWYWKELTSSDRGVIIEQLNARLLQSKFLTGNQWVPVGVLLDQFYKNIELPLPSEPGVVRRAIQSGVQEGAFGLADLREGQPAADTLRFRIRVELPAIDQNNETVLLRAELAALLDMQRNRQPPTQPGITTPGQTSGALPQPGGGVPPDPKPEPKPTPGGERPAETKYQRLHLVVRNVPAGRIADVNRGIFMPLSGVVSNLTFTLEIDVTSSEGIAQSTIENTIKETIRQIGATIAVEERE